MTQKQTAASDLREAKDQYGAAIQGSASPANADSGIEQGFFLHGVKTSGMTGDLSSGTPLTTKFDVHGDVGLYGLFLNITGSTLQYVTAEWWVEDADGKVWTGPVNHGLYLESRDAISGDTSYTNINTLNSSVGWEPTSGQGYHLIFYDPTKSADVLPIIPDGWKLAVKLSFSGGETLAVTGTLVSRRG